MNRKNRTSNLVLWLNNDKFPGDTGTGVQGKNTLASRNRLIGLLTDLQHASAELQSMVKKGPLRNFWNDPPRELTDRLDRIDRRLFEYPARQSVEILEKDGSGGLYLEFGSTCGRPVGEQSAVFEIQSLLNGGQIDRVRQCACKRWYFARRADQKSCSAKCRHRLYEQSPIAKARRQKYMRDYYLLRQSGKVK